MRIKEGFVLRTMGGQPVVVSVGAASKVFNGMIKLNDTGEFLWKQMSEGASKDELVKALLEKYDVSEDMAEQDVTEFINILREPGIIEL